MTGLLPPVPDSRQYFAQHLPVMGCFSTEGICCSTDLGHLAHPPPSTAILWGCTGHGALIAPVFGTIPNEIRFVPLMGWVLVSNAAFLGLQFGVLRLGWKIACFTTSMGDPQYPMTITHDRIGSLGRMFGSQFLASPTLIPHRWLFPELRAAAASTRGVFSATGHCHALKMA